MDSQVERQPAWKRAWYDSEKFRQSSVFFWVWEVLGAVLLAAVTYLLLADQPLLSALAGVAGFVVVFSLIYVANLVAAPIRQRNEAWKLVEQFRTTPVARLAFGEPKTYPRESTGLVRTRILSEGLVEELPGQLGVRLSRVPLTNVSPGTIASNVRVTLSSEPQLDLFPVDVHQKHDNIPPYRRERSVRYGETLEFDVIGLGDDSRLYLFRSDLSPSGYVHAIDDPKILGAVLKLTAITDPPGEGDAREYQLKGGVLREITR